MIFKKIIKLAISLCLVFIGIYNLFFIEVSEIKFYIKFIHNWSLSLLITHLIPSVFISLGGILLLKFISEELKKINKKVITIISIILILLSIATPYLISPIAEYALINNPELNNNKEHADLIKKYINLNELNNETTVVALFSTNCYYCFEAANKIGITQKFKSFKKVITLFPSLKRDAELFIRDAKYQTEMKLCSKDDFLNLTGGSYPKFFLIKNKSEIYSYSASAFQNRTIDLLSSNK